MAEKYVSETNLKEFFNNIYAKVTPDIVDNTVTLLPNREYDCGGAVITNLNIKFGTAADSYSSEYIISFTLGATPDITFPSSVIWAGGIKPNFIEMAEATCLLCFVPLGNYMLGTWVAIKEE